MYLYDSYCYPDTQAVASSVLSGIELNNGGLITAVDVLSVGNISIEYVLAGSTLTHTIALPECFREGFDNSFTGLTIDDAQTMAWQGALVLVIAWGLSEIKILMGR